MKRTNYLTNIYIGLIFVCVVILLYIRSRRRRYSEKFTSLSDTFNTIYKNKVWSTQGDGSGTGSEPQNNEEFRKILTKLVKDNNAKVFVDAPCGACKWTKVWLEELKAEGIKITYLGFDIADDAIKLARENLAPLMDYHTIKIEHADISSSKLPQADILMCRDTLQHLSHDTIQKAIKNLNDTQSKLYILGGYPHGTNKDINNGDYFSINYLTAPYNMHPDSLYREYNKNEDYAEPKYLFVFKSLL